jgi:hypothetical protein
MGNRPIILPRDDLLKEAVRDQNIQQGDFFCLFFFYVLFSTLLHLPPLRFHCVEGCWDRTYCCDFGIGSQTL